MTRRPFTQWSARILAAGGLVLAFFGIAPSMASAAEGSAPPAASAAVQPVAEFQCGPNNWIGYLVPDNPPGGANFTPACVNHDRCYSAGSPTNRADCDSRFYAEMLTACVQANAGTSCNVIASVYYGAVRSAGSRFYQGSGLNN